MKIYGCVFFSLLATGTTAITYENAEDAFTTLQQWYNESIGLWIPSTGWWNSANCLTVIADLAKIDDSVKVQAEAIYPNTFVRAQQYNLQMQKSVDPSSLIHCHYGDHWPHFPPGHHRPRPHRTNGFLNESVYHLPSAAAIGANLIPATTMTKV